MSLGAPEHFPEKWTPVFRRKCDQATNLERVPELDLVETWSTFSERALGLDGLAESRRPFFADRRIDFRRPVFPCERGKPLRCELSQRPDRRPAHQRGRIGKQPLGFRRERGGGGIADRDQHVADEPVATGALDRRSCEQRTKLRVVEPCEIRKPRRPQRLARGELRLAARARELVPG